MPEGVPTSLFYQENLGGFLMMTVRNEIKAQIVRAGYTMQEVVDRDVTLKMKMLFRKRSP